MTFIGTLTFIGTDRFSIFHFGFLSSELVHFHFGFQCLNLSCVCIYIFFCFSEKGVPPTHGHALIGACAQPTVPRVTTALGLVPDCCLARRVRALLCFLRQVENHRFLSIFFTSLQCNHVGGFVLGETQPDCVAAAAVTTCLD
jgi:hypothetical protein